jgi:hypothetical protein
VTGSGTTAPTMTIVCVPGVSGCKSVTQPCPTDRPCVPAGCVPGGIAAQRLAFDETVPTQKGMAREGVDSVTDLVALGDQETVRQHLQRHLDAGATDVILTPLDGDNVTALQAIWQNFRRPSRSALPPI